MMFYETSALEGTKVEEAFLQMAKAALKRESDKSLEQKFDRSCIEVCEMVLSSITSRTRRILAYEKLQ